MLDEVQVLVRNMVARWGMSDAIGMVQVAPRENPFLQGSAGFGGQKPISEQTAALVDAQGQSTVDVTFEAGMLRQSFTQHGRQEIRRR